MARECYEIARQTDDHAVHRELLWLAVKWTVQAELTDKPHHSKLHKCREPGFLRSGRALFRDRPRHGKLRAGIETILRS
jgi:hypothetical protein